MNPLQERELLGKTHAEWSETQDGNEWDDFVVQNGGSIFHLWSWRKVLEGDYSRPLYLACRDEKDSILAVCPFFYQAGRHLLYLNSLPDSQMAGPIFSSRATNTSQIIASLQKSVKFSPSNPVVTMRIKVQQQQIIQPMIALGFQYRVRYGLFIVDLHEKPPEHIWSNGFQKHDRQAVKYYEQRGSEFGFARSERDYLDYLALERGPTADLNDRADFLSKVRLYMGDQLKVGRVTFEGNVIAGFSMLCDSVTSTVHLADCLSFRHREKHSPMKNIHSSGTYINWKMINWAYEHGFRYVDLGSYSVDASSNPANLSSKHKLYASKLKERFEVTFLPTYQFILPTSSITYSIARRISRVMRSLD